MKKLTKKQALDSKGNVWDTAKLKALIDTNDKAALRALELIWNRQTVDEKSDEDTKYYNGRGFSSPDARKLTGIHDFYVRKKYVSEKQMVVIRKKMKKYTGQLLEVMRTDNPQAV